MNQNDENLKPYYTSICKDKIQFPYLNVDLETEVIIIGGGISGALLGYYFSKSNIKTVVLEKGRVGYCNTAASPGILKYELDSTNTKLKAVLTSSEIFKAYGVGVKGINEIEKIIQEEGNHCSFQRCDCFLYTNQCEEINEILEEYNFRKRGGFDCIYIDDTINPFSFEIKAGIISKRGGATLDPYAFTKMLFSAGTKYGLEIFENTEATNVSYFKDFVQIKTNFDYFVKGKIVICATGNDIRLFTFKHFADKEITYNIVTSKVQDTIQGITNTIILNNNSGDYISSASDENFIFGGERTDELEVADFENICESKYDNLKNKLQKILNKEDLKVDYKYYTVCTKTRDHLGFIGKDLDRPNLYFCLGYGANGILYSVMGAKALLQMYIDQKEGTNTEPEFDLKLFNINRLKKIKIDRK